ncbi:MAG: hypothetical protein ACLGIJ_10655 [Candidatus Limnocylindria bacterium]
MPALIVFTAIVAAFAIFGAAAMRWGADSRDWQVDRFASTALGIR